MMTNDRAHLTAITRKTMSKPMRMHSAAGRLQGRVLDYGCGRGFDVNALGIEGFDPHYAPVKPEGKFDTITCNFVLNVVDETVAAGIIADIKSMLVEGGVAYITVRRDVKQDGFTSTGTFQRNVVLDLPCIYDRKGEFATYVLNA